MFALEAKQIRGGWALISTHASRADATDAMQSRAGYRHRTVTYRIILI